MGAYQKPPAFPIEAARAIAEGIVGFIAMNVASEISKIRPDVAMNVADHLDELQNYYEHLLYEYSHDVYSPENKMIDFGICINDGVSQEDRIYLIFIARYHSIPRGTLLEPRRFLITIGQDAYKVYRAGLSMPPIPDIDMTIERSVNLEIAKLTKCNPDATKTVH